MISASELFKNIVNELMALYDKNEATSIARIVFKEKLSLSRTDLVTEPLRQINKHSEDKVTRITQRLLEGYPIQYLLGYADFCGMRLKVNKIVLIPRPETEELVELIVKESYGEEGLRVLDIGTGSGCIAIALAKRLKDTYVTGVDISEKALKIADENAIANGTDVEFYGMDIFKRNSWQNLGDYDIIVSNPPYITESEKRLMHINVLDHEPHSALFVPDDDPLKFYRKICSEASSHLSNGGKLFFEVNSAYGKEVMKIASDYGFTGAALRKDLNNRDRFISAEYSIGIVFMGGFSVMDSLGG